MHTLRIERLVFKKEDGLKRLYWELNTPPAVDFARDASAAEQQGFLSFLL